jgi:serine-type D-Ala-D-Ala carboxypeptidase/endopeptidase (penicillin-binding protein 4)
MNGKKFLACIVCLFLIGCQSLPQQVGINTQTPEKTQDITPEQSAEPRNRLEANDVPLPTATQLSTLPKDVELQQKIVETIEKSEFKNARWGVFAVSLKDGRVVASVDAQKLFTPASVQKAVTTAVAFDKLGKDYRWKTSVLSDKEIGADGTLNGDLVLYGRGAPDFDEPDMASLVNQLKGRGLKRVAGNIVGDSSFFRADSLGSGWVWEEAQWYYGAEPSALSYSDNTVLVEIVPSDNLNEPAQVKTTPEGGFIKVSNKAVTTANGSTQTVGVHRDLDANNFQVWGEVPRGKPFAVRTTMHAPQIWASNELKKTLEKNGITVGGSAIGFDWRTTNINPAQMRELAFVESDTLFEIAKRTNKRSLNLNAELMLRTIGQKAREANGEQNGKKTMLNDDALGAMAIKNWLAQKGVAVGETMIHDGSGLSRLNFISPETMGRLLVFASQMNDSSAFVETLPVAGVDGTLGGRLPDFKDKVFAKTGSISYVNALAGYTIAKNDETFAFVVFCNNETNKGNSVGTIDKITGLIAGYPDFNVKNGTPSPTASTQSN